jgi:hypothetical protein
VLSFLSSRRNWDTPTTQPQASVPPPPQFWGEGQTRWQERGWESPNSDEGTYTAVLFIYTYFVFLIILAKKTTFLNPPFFLQSSESELPVCSPYSVCGKLDTYGTPWLERQCRCPHSSCPSSLQPRDGHTIHDRTKQYKVIYT